MIRNGGLDLLSLAEREADPPGGNAVPRQGRHDVLRGQPVDLDHPAQEICEIAVVPLALDGAELDGFDAAQVLPELDRLDAVAADVEPEDVLQHRHRRLPFIGLSSEAKG